MTGIAAHSLLLLGLALPDGTSRASDGKVAGRPDHSIESPATGALDDGRVAAQAALAEGNRRLKEGDPGGAIKDYRRAQLLHPPAASKIEFNIAKAEAARGDEPAAVTAFERFLSQSLDISTDFREEARSELHRLSAALGALLVAEKRPGLLVVIDGQARGKTPVDGGLWVRPGRHVITLEEGDREMFRDSIVVEAGAHVRITVTMRSAESEGAQSRQLRPLVALTPPWNPRVPLLSRPIDVAASGGPTGLAIDRPIWKRWWFWTAVGVAVVAGSTFWILESHSDCPSHTTCISVSPPSYQP